MERVGLSQHKRLVEVLLVPEELVECSDGKLGPLGDLVHGYVVVSPLREQLERGGEHFLALPQFLPFPPRELLLSHRRTLRLAALRAIFMNMTSHYEIVCHFCQEKPDGNDPRTRQGARG